MDAIVNVYPCFTSIPDKSSEEFELFCWTELLLYKHFRSIEEDIGLTKNTIEENWKEMNAAKYSVWHIQRLTPILSTSESEEEDDITDNEST